MYLKTMENKKRSFENMLELVKQRFLSFWLFCVACGILVPQQGIEPASPALEAQVLTAGPPQKSQDKDF